MVPLIAIQHKILLLNLQLNRSARIQKGKDHINALVLLLFLNACAISHCKD